MKLFRNIVIFLLLVVAITAIIFYFVVNSTYAAQKFADNVAAKYGFTFGEFSGNAMEGIETDAVYFQDKKLASFIKLKVSPMAILNSKIKISDLELDGVHKENLFAMIKYFSARSKNKPKKQKLVSFSYEINNGTMTTLPFVMGGIPIESFKIKSSYLFYKQGLFEGDAEFVEIQSNLGVMAGSCSFRDKVLSFDDFNAKDINSQEIQSIIKSKRDESNQQKTKTKVAKKPSPFVPNVLTVKEANIVLLPRKLSDMSLSKITINAEEFKMDFEEKSTSGTVWVETSSNIASLKSKVVLTPNVAKFEEIGLGNVDLTQLDSYLLAREKSSNKFKKIAYFPTVVSIGKVNIKNINGELKGIDFKHGKIEADGKSRAIDLLREDASFVVDGSVSVIGSIGKDSLDVKSSTGRLEYFIGKKSYSLRIDAKIFTKYSKDISLKAEISNRYGLEYVVNAKSPSVNIDDQWNGLLSGLRISVIGNKDNIRGEFESDYIKGSVASKDTRLASVRVVTKKAIPINKYMTVPDSILETKVNLEIEAPIRLKKILPIEAKVKMSSNLIDMNAVVYYNKNLRIDGKVSVPNESILRGISPKMKYDALNPMKIEFAKNNSDYTLGLKRAGLVLDGKYNSQNKTGSADVKMLHSKASMKSNGSSSIKIYQQSASIKDMLKEIDGIYPVGESPVDGDIRVESDLSFSGDFTANVTSSQLVLGDDKKRSTKIKNITMSFLGNPSDIVLQKYRMDLDKNSIFATKPSKVSFRDGYMVADPLWINDNLETRGRYNFDTSDGSFTSRGSGIEIEHDLASVVMTADLNSVIDKDRKSFTGDIHLSGGEIKYDLKKATIASDSDIVVLQRVKKKNDNAYIKNVKLDINLNSNKPLLYKQKDLNVQMIPNLQIKKEYGKSAVLKGEVTLVKGGYYIFEGKKFVLKKSHIYFKESSLTPTLDIRANYKHAGKSTLISVTGTSKNPVLNFNSASRDEVISDILFDTEGGVGDGQSDDIGRLLAGSVAKKLLRGMGLEVDHLVFRGDGFEIGKKISKKVTVIYDQEESSSIKVRIENSRRIETDISFGKESGSVDVYYKKEF